MNEDFYFQQKTWKEIYMNVYFSSTCNKLRNFQLKLLHRCLPRKRILFNANKCEDPLCNFCKNEPDSLIHIYVTCPMIRKFWVEGIEFINMLFPNITTLTTIDIIFGAFLSKNELLSFIIIATKYYIHRCYWSNKSPNIASLKWKFKQYEIVERLNVIKIDKLRNHNVKWEKFTNMYSGMNV